MEVVHPGAAFRLIGVGRGVHAAAGGSRRVDGGPVKGGGGKGGRLRQGGDRRVRRRVDVMLEERGFLSVSKEAGEVLSRNSKWNGGRTGDGRDQAASIRWMGRRSHGDGGAHGVRDEHIPLRERDRVGAVGHRPDGRQRV